MSAPLDLNALAASSIHEVKNLLGQLTLSLEEIAQVQCPGSEQQMRTSRKVLKASVCLPRSSCTRDKFA